MVGKENAEVDGCRAVRLMMGRMDAANVILKLRG